MKLADIDVGELIDAMRNERSEWINVARAENRENTEAESTVICILHALERVLGGLPPYLRSLT
jgi:hypothetical protein